MLASELIVPDLQPLKLTDTGEDGLRMMEDLALRHLPVVKRKELQGVISEEEILEHDTRRPISTYNIQFKPVYVNEYDHIFEVLEIVALTNLTCIPVLDKQLKYKGLITLESLVQQFATLFSFNESGAIIVIEMRKSDYSLTEVSRIIELENGMILSSFITTHPDPGLMYLTLKINLLEVQFLNATLERFGYVVKATFTEAEYIDTLKERYESLMNFLNI